MRWFQTSFRGFRQAAVTAWLSGLVLFFTLAAPCAAFHNRVHPGHGRAGQTCVLCLMIQGQVDCAEAAPIQDTFVPRVNVLTPALECLEFRQTDVRLAPSRAPPGC